jgi:glycine/D-amino acid oxidase-like deaminating enzyme
VSRYTALVAAAKPAPFWLDQPDAPALRERLPGNTTCDLAVVGGGFSGLWTALLAKEHFPEMSVVLVEGNRIGWAASGRNGGFCEARLTHGEANGKERFPAEFDTLQRLGRENLDAIEATVRRYGIECDFERTGEITVATAEYQAAEFRGEPGYLDAAAVRAQVNSPTYLAGVWDKDGCAMVQPARLAWGLARACEQLGVRLYERTPVSGLASDADGVTVRTREGIIRARRVALGTNAFPSLIKRLRRYTVPLYDYVLVTEPLSAAQLATIGWTGRQGVGDSANRFHYYRLSPDNRILFGGYDAIYHFGGGVRAAYDQRPATFTKLAGHFFETFPQLAGIGFTHRWGGAIDTCSRFCAFFGTAHRGRVSYALGFTGLGVGATRFGARVMLDLLGLVENGAGQNGAGQNGAHLRGGAETELTRLDMVRSKPIPFPPEPLTYLGIQATRWSLDRADRNEGKRNLWLRTLDAVGMGFDS